MLAVQTLIREQCISILRLLLLSRLYLHEFFLQLYNPLPSLDPNRILSQIMMLDILERWFVMRLLHLDDIVINCKDEAISKGLR